MDRKGKTIRLICKPHCSFYREGKEVLLCGASRFVLEIYNDRDIKTVSSTDMTDESIDRWILKRVCRKCSFYPEGCGFRLGQKSPSCGGYHVLVALRKKFP